MKKKIIGISIITVIYSSVVTGIGISAYRSGDFIDFLIAMAVLAGIGLTIYAAILIAGDIK